MSVIYYISSFLPYLFLVFGAGVFLAYIYFQYAFGYWKKKGVEFVEPSFPFGNIRKLVCGKTHLLEMFKELHNCIKGPFAGVYFLNNPAVMIKDPFLIKQILVKDFNSFMDRGVHTDVKNDPMSGHLFRLTGQKWRDLRTKLSPIFTSGKLKMMFPLLIKSGNQLQHHLEGVVKIDANVDVKDVCSKYTIDVISSVAFGVESNSFENPNNDIRKFTTQFSDIGQTFLGGLGQSLGFCVPGVMKVLKLRNASEELTNYIINLLERIINSRETSRIVRNDFVQCLIQLRNKGEVSKDDHAGDASVYDEKNIVHGLTIKEMAAQAFVFILAGYDTSASTMSFCLYELAKHPEIQKRVQKDIDDILAKYNGEINYESVSEMEYLGMAISETLRLYPVLGFLNRLAIKNYQIPDSDVIIEKNTQIILSVSGLHLDPDNFSEPMKFDPERFNHNNKDKIKPYTYLPFGDGPRNCIGMRLGKMQTKVGLVMILSKYNFSVCSKTPKKVTAQFGPIIFNPKEQIILSATRRSK